MRLEYLFDLITQAGTKESGMINSLNWNQLSNVPICARNLTAKQYIEYGVPPIIAHLVQVFGLCPRDWETGCDCRDPAFDEQGNILHYGTPWTEDVVLDEDGYWDNRYIDHVAFSMKDPAFYRADYQVRPKYERAQPVIDIINQHVLARSPPLRTLIQIEQPDGDRLIQRQMETATGQEIQKPGHHSRGSIKAQMRQISARIQREDTGKVRSEAERAPPRVRLPSPLSTDPALRTLRACSRTGCRRRCPGA